MRTLKEAWTGDIVGRLHSLNSTQIELAAYCGYTPEYLSSVLNGKKHFESEYAKRCTKKRIFTALEELERAILNE